MYFTDRMDAAIQLAGKLEKYKDTDGVILAVPRGGVPIGYYLAKHLHLGLDLLMTKKLGHPHHEEYAIGAVGLEDSILEDTEGVPDKYIETQIAAIRKQLKERYQVFMGGRAPLDIRGKVVIVTDDGVATGRTILATTKMLRRHKPRKLVVAVPVASQEAAKRIAGEVDEFICLYTPSPFLGVGLFYEDFSPTTDEEVQSLLNDLNRGKTG